MIEFIENEEDLCEQHGLCKAASLTALMAKEISLEIDRKILSQLKEEVMFREENTKGNFWLKKCKKETGPSLIFDKIMPMQPMSEPTSLIYYLRWRYSSNKGSAHIDKRGKHEK